MILVVSDLPVVAETTFEVSLAASWAEKDNLF